MAIICLFIDHCTPGPRSVSGLLQALDSFFLIFILINEETDDLIAMENIWISRFFHLLRNSK